MIQQNKYDPLIGDTLRDARKISLVIYGPCKNISISVKTSHCYRTS